MIKYYFLLLISFAIIPSISFGNIEATKKLHLYLLELDLLVYNKKPISLKVVKDLVNEGADIHALGPTGGSAAHVASESYAYISSTNYSYPSGLDGEKVSFDIVEYLVKLGSDISTPDFRGLSPLYVVLRWGDAKYWDKFLNLLVTHGSVDINNVGVDGMGRGVLYLTTSKKYRDIFNKLLDEGLDLKAVLKYKGETYAHSLAKMFIKGEPVSVLEKVTEKYFVGEEFKWLSRASFSGETPLHIAAKSNNIPALKYMIEKYNIDVDSKTDAGLKAIDYALSSNKIEAYNYLKSFSHSDYVISENLDCLKENSFKPTYDKIKELILKCDLKSIDSLLPLLPKRFLANYTLAFNTLAVQDASPSHPLVGVFGEDGTLMMSFNGDDSQRGYRNLEMIQFREDTNSFEMRDVKFPNDLLGEVSFSEANPSKCLACHGVSPRPLWDSWTFWPGKFNGESSSSFPKEREIYSKFVPNKTLPRYVHLPTRGTGPLSSFDGKSIGVGFANSDMDSVVATLMTKKIAAELKTDYLLRPYRYAFLTNFHCKEMKFSEYIPESRLEKFLFSLDYLELDTRAKATREANNRLKFLESSIGGAPQSRYVLQQKYFGNFIPNQGGRNFKVNATAKLRYIAENVGFSTENWSTPFNNGLESYLLSGLSYLEKYAWKQVLDPVLDSHLRGLLEDTTSDHKIAICSELKQKSLASLK